MYWLLALMSVSVLGVVALGIYFEIRPVPRNPSTVNWLKGTVGVNLLTYFGALVGILFLGVNDVMAAEPAAVEAAKEVSVGLGLALIGIGLPTAVATIAAGIADGPLRNFNQWLSSSISAAYSSGERSSLSCSASSIRTVNIQPSP